jgi:hypothetical protein
MKLRGRNGRLRSDKKSRIENRVKSRQINALHSPGGIAITDRAGIARPSALIATALSAFKIRALVFAKKAVETLQSVRNVSQPSRNTHRNVAKCARITSARFSILLRAIPWCARPTKALRMSPQSSCRTDIARMGRFSVRLKLRQEEGSRSRHQSKTASLVQLRREQSRGFRFITDLDKPERISDLLGDNRQRQLRALVEPSGNPYGFTEMADEGVHAGAGDSPSGFVALDGQAGLLCRI